MPTFLRTQCLIGWLIFFALPVWGQTEKTFDTYFSQGHQFEERGDHRKALDAYRKALNYATATTRPSVQQAINRVDEHIQQEMLVIESQTREIRNVLATLSIASNRERLGNDLIALQRREDATVADYKALLRRANALKNVEANIATSEDTKEPAPSAPRFGKRTPDRQPVKPKPALSPPPPKTIVSSSPGPLKERVRPKSERKAAKSIKDDLH